MTDNLSQIRERWEFVEGGVCGEAYDGDGFVNCDYNGSIHIPNGEAAKHIVKSHNDLLDRVAELETEKEFWEREITNFQRNAFYGPGKYFALCDEHRDKAIAQSEPFATCVRCLLAKSEARRYAAESRLAAAEELARQYEKAAKLIHAGQYHQWNMFELCQNPRCLKARTLLSTFREAK